MEHGLILLIEAILAIDRNLQKPIRAVVPDLSRLRADPKAALADSEIVVGPRKAYAVATVLGFLVAVAVLVMFILAALERPKGQPVETWYMVTAGIGVLACGVAVTALTLRWSRGGSAVLRAEGVEFVYRGRSVFCPWTLFQAAGSPYQPDHKRIILPANHGTPVALTDYEGNVTANSAAEVKSKPLMGTADGQVALADLYEVKLLELGELFLHLGRRLGDGPVVLANGATERSSSAPLATALPGGWLRIRLTRLPFPPVCLGCGAVTRESIQHTLDVRNTVRIELPMCQACQADRRRRRGRAVFMGLAMGLVPGVLAMILGSAFLDFEDLVILGLILFPAGIAIGLIGGVIVRDRTEAARFKDYAAGAGTVSMRLRPTVGAAALLVALGLSEESADPAMTGSAAG